MIPIEVIRSAATETQYPFLLLGRRDSVFPILGSKAQGLPHLFDFSSLNARTLEYDTRHYEPFQSVVEEELRASGRSFGIGRYLEERAALLRHYPQMIQEGRIYHAGVDIVAPEGTAIYAPLGGEIYRVGREEGLGNYGGFLILRHVIDESVFYSLYGHLHPSSVFREGDTVNQGQTFGAIGGERWSGGWFSHVHIQVLTEHAVAQGRIFQGYVTQDDLPSLEGLFPSPYPLLRF